MRVGEEIVKMFFKWYIKVPNNLNRGRDCKRAGSSRSPVKLHFNLFICHLPERLGKGPEAQGEEWGK